jgi:hypothetical protein
VLRNAHGRDVLGSHLCVMADAMGVDKAVRGLADATVSDLMFEAMFGGAGA